MSLNRARSKGPKNCFGFLQLTLTVSIVKYKVLPYFINKCFHCVILGCVLQAVSAASTIFLPSKIAAVWFGEKERATATAIAIAADCLGSGCSYLQPTAMVRNSNSNGTIEIELGIYLWVKVIEAVGIAAFLVLFVKDKPDQPPSRKESERRDLHLQNAKGSPGKSDTANLLPEEYPSKCPNFLPNAEQNSHKCSSDCTLKQTLAQSKTNPVETSSDSKTSPDTRHARSKYSTGKKPPESSSPSTRGTNGSFSKPEEFLNKNMDNKHEGLVSGGEKQDESSSPAAESRASYFAWLKEYKSLFKNRSFVIITIMNGIVYGLDETWLLVLNEVLIKNYPGHEVKIGAMVVVSMVVGMCSNVAIGVILDYTQSFKATTLTVTGLSSLVVTSFTILFIYRIHFSTLFISYVLLIGIHSAYFTIGFEHAAEMTYPVSENHSGVLLIIIGQLFAAVFGRLASAVIYRHGPTAFLCTATGLYFLTFFLALWIKNKGPRTDYAPLETK